MKLNLKEIKEIKLLDANPLKNKKIIDKSKYNEFIKKNENSFTELELIQSIRKISKTWYIYEKLRAQICGWGELDLNWVIKIKEILDQNPKLLKLNVNSFYNFIQLKKEVEKETKTSSIPEKEITCTEITFERNDDYEILF
ncbi:hypothetical protein [Spiroplasma floricola]|uniref:Uncharacterized protein n=1 Tax=Spiroplasma floricola 23-6 TaxID=1336749 RepID=A0A2K8SF04_9MOLU|nr:hypothetical protein [Spiroplasma floricola]AUB32039.1 hypothetical protein SFLOR_v1c09910 [Spiroplasma floricola 23-6]